MTKYRRIGIDTSKPCTRYSARPPGSAGAANQSSPRTIVPFFKKLPPTVIAMEACGSAHYWARELTALGHAVRLIPPQYVEPYASAAKMIATTPKLSAKRRVGRACIWYRSVTQQAQVMVLKVRETLFGQRIALINAVRGHGAEFGVIAAKGARRVGPLPSAIEQETAIPPEAIEMFSLLGRQ